MNFGAAVCVVGLTATSVASVFDSAMAQQKSLRERLLGAWTLVSIVATRPDGNKEEPFSTDEGILMFDGSGYFSVQLCKRGRPKYASNNRLKGTLEEYQASAQGCYTAWGRYTVSEPAGTRVSPLTPTSPIASITRGLTGPRAMIFNATTNVAPLTSQL